MYKFSTIVFLLLAFNFSFAQSKEVLLSADIKTIGVNDIITFTVKTNIQGEIKLDFPSSFQINSGISSGLEEEINYKTGKTETIYSFSQFGNFNQVGKFKIRAFIKDKKTYKSNELNIHVIANSASKTEISKTNLKKDAFGIIDISKTQLYEGEPLIISAKNYSKYPVTLVESYFGFSFKSGVQRFDLDKSKKLVTNKENIKGKNFYVFNYGKQLIFTNQIGNLEIEPFEMSFRFDKGKLYSEKIQLLSNKSVVNVIPLPSPTPSDFIGAVGDYSLSLSFPKKDIKLNEVFDVEVVLSGSGNLHNVKFLKLNLPSDFVIFGNPIIKKNFAYGVNGVEGSLKYTYHIQATREGRLIFPSVSVSYFNPSDRAYIKLKQKAVTLTCTKSDMLVGQDDLSTNKLVKNSPAVNSTIQEDKKSFFKSTPFIVSTLTLFSTASLFLFLFLKKNPAQEKLKKRQSKIDWDLSVLTFREKLVAFSANENATEVFTLAPKLIFEAVRIATKDEQLTQSKNEIIKAVNILDKSLTQTVDQICNDCEVGRFGHMNTDSLLLDIKKHTLDLIERLTSIKL